MVRGVVRAVYIAEPIVHMCEATLDNFLLLVGASRVLMNFVPLPSFVAQNNIQRGEIL